MRSSASASQVRSPKIVRRLQPKKTKATSYERIKDGWWAIVKAREAGPNSELKFIDLSIGTKIEVGVDHLSLWTTS